MFASVRNQRLLGSSALVILGVMGAASAQEPGVQPPVPPVSKPDSAPSPAAPPAAAPAPEAGAPAEAPPAAVPPETLSIPEIKVTAPKQTARRTAAAPPPVATAQPSVRTAQPPPTPEQTAAAQVREVVQKIETLDQRRDDLLPKTGTSSETKSAKDIENLPQGSNAQIRDVVLQYPGVTQDSASSGEFHVRNEHANVQYRINGILLPEGAAGFSQFLETGFIKGMTLITGALPAQYGLRTAGILDITTKSGAALQGGNVGVYGGSRETLSNFFEYGGLTGQTEYFATGRYTQNSLGLENPDNLINAIHDQTYLGRFFGYTSTLLDESTRLSTITGVSVQRFQIPNNPGQPTINQSGGSFPGMTVYGISSYNSSNLNENQYEKNAYGVVAWQRSVGDVDAQLSYFSRYASVHFVPDIVGDMLFNGVATDVLRTSFVNGLQGDGAYRMTDAHTLRAGFTASGEQTQIPSTSTVEALNAAGNAIEPPFNIYDGSNKFGWLFGGYLQDEWKVTNQLTFNTGLRFDQMFQYVQANQLSPRFNLTYQPFWGTVFHAGYSRNFTPPPQDLGRVYQAQLFNNTTNASEVSNSGAILPERSNVVDGGFTQQLFPQCRTADGGMPTKAAPIAPATCPAAEIGFDAYYKRAQDLLDDGQFGQAYVLTAFNYAKAENVGLEAKGKLTVGNFSAYTNWAIAHQVANTVVSNQSLFAPNELTYIANNWINTDHAQAVTGSAGISYLWDQGSHSWIDGSKISATMIYGSGLRSGFANTDHLPAYGQVNLGLSKEFEGWGWNGKPLSVRFDVVNLFDEIYQIRNGTGIGVFAPQYGPRRGYYIGISQKL